MDGHRYRLFSKLFLWVCSPGFCSIFIEKMPAKRVIVGFLRILLRKYHYKCVKRFLSLIKGKIFIGATQRQRHFPKTYSGNRNHVHLPTYIISHLYNIHGCLGLLMCFYQLHRQQKIHCQTSSRT